MFKNNILIYDKTIFVTLVFLSYLGCNTSEPNYVRVVVDKTDLSSGKISIDEKQNYYFKDSLITLKLPSGKHTIVYNNESKQDFYVGNESEGLLNLDNREYVAFEIEYDDPNSKESLTENDFIPKAIVVIDSFIIMRRQKVTDLPSDSLLNNILPKLMTAKNGNYMLSLPEENYQYDNNESVKGIKKFGKDKLYIKRFWDYSLGEEIPQSLSVRPMNSTLSVIKDTRTRIAIINSSDFLAMAKLSSKEYYLIDVRKINKNSK